MTEKRFIPVNKTISITTSCYNEDGNLQEWYDRIIAVLKKIPQYDYEFVVADNCSTDRSRSILREIALRDKKFRVIFNSNNFGWIRSPFNALLQARGSAVVQLSSDLQDPPEMIEDFIRHWEAGIKVVVGVKPVSRENPIMSLFRRIYYKFLDMMSETPQIQNFNGFGLFDRQFMDAVKLYNEPYPYFRGLIGEIGFSRIEVPYIQDARKHGTAKSNFLRLYDAAMTGFVNHSKLPLRMAVFIGFTMACFSFVIALAYLVYKLCCWNNFSLGLAPVVIGLFFFSAVQLIFIGIIGEYVGAIWTQVKNHPLVIEEERINFEE